MKKIFIDGSAGTTGLRIAERLEQRADIELIKLPEELRKDAAARKEALNKADVAFLCLPDDAARESVSFIENEVSTPDCRKLAPISKLNKTAIIISTRLVFIFCPGIKVLLSEIAKFISIIQ